MFANWYNKLVKNTRWKYEIWYEFWMYIRTMFATEPQTISNKYRISNPGRGDWFSDYWVMTLWLVSFVWMHRCSISLGASFLKWKSFRTFNARVCVCLRVVSFVVVVVDNSGNNRITARVAATTTKLTSFSHWNQCSIVRLLNSSIYSSRNQCFIAHHISLRHCTSFSSPTLSTPYYASIPPQLLPKLKSFAAKTLYIVFCSVHVIIMRVCNEWESKWKMITLKVVYMCEWHKTPCDVAAAATAATASILSCWRKFLIINVFYTFKDLK